jgi:radical SAM protein with 4Fe4S-binding SPASM domain
MTLSQGTRSEFKQVVIEVTEACNHACLHCYNYWRPNRVSGTVVPQTRQRQLLTRAEILRLIRKVRRSAPISSVAISGGEPFLRPDLPEIVGDMAAEGLAVVTITNGTLLTESRLKRMPAGSYFEVTLFSTNRETHNFLAGRDCFNTVVANLDRLPAFHCHFVLAMVITRLNVRDVMQTIELGIALGARGVLLNRVNLGRQGLPIADDLVPSADELRGALQQADRAAEKYGIGVAVSVPVPPCVADPRDYPHLHFGWCPRGGKDAYYTIGCTGLLRPCNHSSLVLGDLKKQSFASIVNGVKAKTFWAPMPAACQECFHPLKDVCAGGCRAAAFECYGDTDHIDPFVAFALTATQKPGQYQIGNFPSSATHPLDRPRI